MWETFLKKNKMCSTNHYTLNNLMLWFMSYRLLNSFGEIMYVIWKFLMDILQEGCKNPDLKCDSIKTLNPLVTDQKCGPIVDNHL